jgi:hypothetical protein
MSTRQTDPAPGGDLFDVRLYGPGAATFGLFDARGKGLIVRRLIVSGPDNVEARCRLPRTVQLRSGAVPVVPVLMHRARDQQRVTFDGLEAESATATRVRDLRLTKAAFEKIQQAANQVAARGGDPGAMISAGAGSRARRRATR